MKGKVCAFTLLMCAAPAQAQVMPEPGPGDPRMQSVLYDPDQVVQLQIAPNYQVSIEFSPEERIENIALGDIGAWEVTPNKRGDHLFIRSLNAGSATNLTVITDARSYSFELMPGYGAPTPFTVRFRYAPALSLNPVGTSPSERYGLLGDRALRPNAIHDDGVRTYIVWNAAKPLPAIFARDQKGKEVVVEGAMREGRYVIDDIHNELIFRLGDKRASAWRRPQRKAP